MDSKQIENLLYDSDVLSSSLSEFDDSDEDPDWQNDNDENYENNMVDCDSNADDDVESEWNDNFDIPNINSNIIFNPHDSTGINTDIIDKMFALMNQWFRLEVVLCFASILPIKGIATESRFSNYAVMIFIHYNIKYMQVKKLILDSRYQLKLLCNLWNLIWTREDVFS